MGITWQLEVLRIGAWPLMWLEGLTSLIISHETEETVVQIIKLYSDDLSLSYRWHKFIYKNNVILR